MKRDYIKLKKWYAIKKFRKHAEAHALSQRTHQDMQDSTFKSGMKRNTEAAQRSSVESVLDRAEGKRKNSKANPVAR